jgi:hypothetical protein
MHKPGSFSKNFAWHGHGLKKLHDAIRAGSQGRLVATQRDEFRNHCGIDDADLQLIPVNFFLHNTILDGDNYVSIDELVYQAVWQDHSLKFDRLALFALHLNRAGERRGTNGEEKPVTWIRAFVSRILWKNGGWETASLDAQRMDDFFATVLDATDDVRTKCRTNYRHLFELCEFLPSKGDVIATGADAWVQSALFLMWDRYLLDSRGNFSLVEEQLGHVAKNEEFHKLLGIPDSCLDDYLAEIAPVYLALGGLNRFSRHPSIAGPVDQPLVVTSSSGGAAVISKQWNDGDSAGVGVARRLQELRVQRRNPINVRQLRQLYRNECMFCGTQLLVGTSPPEFYAECAHIKPVGKPHNGPDTKDNMLVLCPNHHVQFDFGIITLQKARGGYLIESKIPNSPLNGRLVTPKEPHVLNDELVAWHRSASETAQGGRR